jgi:hypothetical protein
MKVTSQTFSLTSFTPTFCPAYTLLRLILRRPVQMRPQRAPSLMLFGFRDHVEKLHGFFHCPGVRQIPAQ